MVNSGHGKKLRHIKVTYPSIHSQIKRVVSAVRIRAVVVDALGPGIRGEQRESMSKAPLNGGLQRMIDRRKRLLIPLNIAEVRERPARLDVARPRLRGIQRKDRLQVRPLATHIGDLGHQLPWQLPLEREVPLLAIAKVCGIGILRKNRGKFTEAGTGRK